MVVIFEVVIQAKVPPVPKPAVLKVCGELEGNLKALLTLELV
jgi:hypothetical protein